MNDDSSLVRSQLRAALAPHGYSVHAVAVDGCLHLKTAATAVADDLLLVNPRWVSPETIADAAPGAELMEVDPAEPFGANALRVGEAVVYPAAFPRTREHLEARGLRVHAVAFNELAKAEGGVTCCSLIVDVA